MENDPDLTSKQQHRVLMRLLNYTKSHRRLLVTAFGLLLLSTAGEVLGPLLIKIFIDDYLTPGNLEFQPLFTLAAAYVLIQMANVMVTYFQQIKFQEIALRVIYQLRVDLFSKVHRLGLRYFERTPAGSIVSRVTNDTEAIKEMFVSVLLTFIQSGFLMIGILIAMFSLNVKLAIFCLLILPVIFLIVHLYRKHSSRVYQDLREQLGRLNAKLSESLQGMAIIQMFRQEKRMRDDFERINQKHYLAGMTNIKIDGLLLRPAVDLLYAFALVLILSFFGITSLNSPIEIGVLYAFINYLDRFIEPVNQMMMRLSMYQQAIVAGSRVFHLLDEEDVSPEQGDKGNLISEGEIEFRNVSFSYDGKQDVLKNISFTAKPGESVAIVGHTGSGKSSMINLLMRFYEFDRGDIFIDGVSIKDYSNEELRKHLGLVLQEPFLFFGTVKDNIRMYQKELTDDQVVNAAKFVHAHPFIERLEHGYSNRVVERGATFSSGQRQLIAFARTIAAKPKILILDEATSNIDTETEEIIQTALSEMRKNRTTITIAHRLSTIQDADLILVLHRGRIIERGTHQELLAVKGLYHKMFLLQNGSSDAVGNISQ